MAEPTWFEDRTLQEVIESYLYTSDNMFGEIICDAKRELYKRFPPPDWAKRHPLPTLAKEFHSV